MYIFRFVGLIWLVKQLFRRRTITHNPIGPFADEMSLWDKLPGEVACYIFAKLSLTDRVRMMSVSKSWRHTLLQDHVPVVPEPPWRIISQDCYSRPEYCLHEVCFSSFDGKNYVFKLPFDGRWWCCGSSNGWLLMAGCGWDENLEEHVNIILWNPISGAIRKLPALSTVPLFSNFIDRGFAQGIESISPFISRVHVFSVESAECVVAAIFVDPTAERYIYSNIGNVDDDANVDDEDEDGDLTKYPYTCLALCTPQDQSWSVVDVEGIRTFQDICFHNGKLYASCEKLEDHLDEDDQDGDEIMGRKTNYRIGLEGCHVEVNVFQLLYDGGFRGMEFPYHRYGLDNHERYQVVEHLVPDIMSGELLVVSAIRDLWFYFEEDDPDPIKSFMYSQTSKFEVRRLVESSDCLEKLDGIGEQAVFLGSKSSVSLTHGIEAANCIYFATDDANGLFTDHMMEEEEDITNGYHSDYRLDDSYRFHEGGVFDLRQKLIEEKFLTILRMQSGSTTGWFTPKLFSI